MPVAKSFQSFEMLTEPYIVSGKQYVKVRNPKTGTERQVRWYSDSEFAKLYPEMKPMVQAQDAFYKPQKEVLGFTKGYITIFKGDTYAHIDWFRASIARYAKWWGWYIISTEEIPNDLPDGLEPIQLPWDIVGNDDGKLKPEHLVKEAVESIIYDASESECVGSIGERLELYLTVERIIKLDNNYGRSTMFKFYDDCGNCFIWITATQPGFNIGDQIHIKGTVKNHNKFKNEHQTILTRCIKMDH